MVPATQKVTTEDTENTEVRCRAHRDTPETTFSEAPTKPGPDSSFGVFGSCFFIGLPGFDFYWHQRGY